MVIFVTVIFFSYFCTLINNDSMESMRKIVGVGESILDILFHGGQPVAAVPGGSSFNSIISVGRAGVPCSFVGFTGADHVGQQTVDFLHANGVGTSFFQMLPGKKSAISLAFLKENGDATYSFYKEPLNVAVPQNLPDMMRGDVLLYGSYYAASHDMRPLITQLLERASRAGSIVYYDLNFRPNHRDELESLMPNILENLSQSTIVRASMEDIEVVFSSRDANNIYNVYISGHCPYFICTAGAEKVTVFTPKGNFEFQVPPVSDVVSTVGAGDSFNAGLSCALLWENIMREDLPSLERDAWQRLITTACRFAAETCRSSENYIAPLAQ